MSVLLEQITKAASRAAGLDLSSEAERCRILPVADLNTTKALETRERFVQKSLGQTQEATEFFERIIQGNELQDANYLAKGAIVARAVARIAIREPNGRRSGWGTGFLIAPGVLITNHHVLTDQTLAKRSEAHFRYERDLSGHLQEPILFHLDPERLFITSSDLDYTLVAVAPRSERDGEPLSQFGHIPLIGTVGKTIVGEWLTIIQHPNGEPKQVCVRENQLLKIAKDVLWYSTDTLGGSSGSPVFSNDWLVVALHHSGVPERKDGRIQTIDNQDWDEQRDGEERIKWIANEGIRISVIIRSLRENHGSHPALQPILNPENPAFSAIPATVPSNPSFEPSRPPVPNLPPAMTTRRITVELEIDEQNNIRLLPANGRTLESTSFLEKSVAAESSIRIDVPFDETYQDRNGFIPELLGKGAMRVNLPVLAPDLKKLATRLLDSTEEDDFILNYYNYSVVMHSKRRLAIYSAASVRGDQRYILKRGKDYIGDAWRADRRIPLEKQITNFYYRKNQFDRGHLSRNEDLEYGPTQKAAIQSAIDTCHYTNATPQHEKFNQGKKFWQGIERHIFENGIAMDAFHVQIFTGPIFEEDDPVYEAFPKIQYPVRFWKVVAAPTASNKLFAAAFILDQSGLIAQHGIEEAARDIPFGNFRGFQVPVSEVEALTRLKFTSNKETPLSAVDPLRNGAPRPRRSRNFNESTSSLHIPKDYHPIDHFDDIILED